MSSSCSAAARGLWPVSVRASGWGRSGRELEAVLPRFGEAATLRPQIGRAAAGVTVPDAESAAGLTASHPSRQ